MKKPLLAFALAFACAAAVSAAPLVRQLEIKEIPSGATGGGGGYAAGVLGHVGPKVAVLFDKEGVWLCMDDYRAHLAGWDKIDAASEKIRGYQPPVIENGVHIYRLAPIRTLTVPPAKVAPKKKTIKPGHRLLYSTSDEGV